MSIQQVTPQQTLETGHQQCLSRPAYLSEVKTCVWGSQSYYSTNYIYWCAINQETRQAERLRALELPRDVVHSQYVSDITAINANTAAVAVGAHVCLLQMEADTGPELRPFVALSTHVDDVRELCYSASSSLLGVAGHDEHLHLLSCGDRKGHVQSFHNGDVVSSVRCCPTDASANFSCTTDSGYINIFDVRQAKLTASINSHTPQLYSHTYINEHLLLCGYNSNSLKLFDTRTMTCIGSIFDPLQLAIGDLQTVKTGDSHIVLAVGAPGWTAWEYPLGADSALAFEPRLQYGGPQSQPPQAQTQPPTDPDYLSGAAVCSEGSMDLLLCTTSTGTAMLFETALFPKAVHSFQV